MRMTNSSSWGVNCDYWIGGNIGSSLATNSGRKRAPEASILDAPNLTLTVDDWWLTSPYRPKMILNSCHWSRRPLINCVLPGGGCAPDVLTSASSGWWFWSPCELVIDWTGQDMVPPHQNIVAAGNMRSGLFMYTIDVWIKTDNCYDYRPHNAREQHWYAIDDYGIGDSGCQNKMQMQLSNQIDLGNFADSYTTIPNSF